MGHTKRIGIGFLVLVLAVSTARVGQAGSIDPLRPKAKIWTQSQLADDVLKRISDSPNSVFGGSPDRAFEDHAPKPFTGIIVERDNDSLTLLNEETRERTTFKLQDIHRLDVASGERSAGALGIFAGGVIGAGVGIMVFNATNERCEGSFGCLLYSEEDLRFRVGVLSGLAGALVGGLVGSAIHFDDWNEVPLGGDFTMAPTLETNRKGASLAFQVRFPSAR